MTPAPSSVDAQMAAFEGALTATVADPPPTGLKVGVDLGTAYTVVVVLDDADRPLAAVAEFADVVRDGVVTDFVGAIDLVRRLKRDVEQRTGLVLTAAHGAFPPGVPRAEVRAVAHVIEAAEMECTGLVDEPTAANAVLGLREGVVVDVGGGTTGIAVVRDGDVVHTADEATGGTHFTLVVAGAHGMPFEQAERLKTDPAEQGRLLPVLRPVMEKVATIVARHTAGYAVPVVHLVGGPAAFPGFGDVVAEVTGIPTVVPASPLFVTPLGIARSAPVRAVSPA
ncbi:MAG TPA: ethanolamine utilization protein EutJ [Dermatophilaceae bacterium]|nr:ethanolamine utilization protein EutJ [Dermatophilaceae bacterium]